MLPIENLQKIDFFNKRTAILSDKELYKVEDVLLPRPMVTAQQGELQLIIKTKNGFDFEQFGMFSEKLTNIFGKQVVISLFEEASIRKAIEDKIGMIAIYRNFLQSAIPINTLSESTSLEEQWRIQENRVEAHNLGPLPTSYIISSMNENLNNKNPSKPGK